MLKNFRTYDLSVEFYHQCKKLKLQKHLYFQLIRAASSVTLNLAEGSAKPTFRDRIRFYNIAFASFRECQAIMHLSDCSTLELHALADRLGSSLRRPSARSLSFVINQRL
jgi:four helix bundle protein